MFFSARGQNKLVGIDIGTTSIKLLELSGSDSAIGVDRYACQSLPRGCVVERRIEDVRRVAGAIKEAARHSGTTARHAVVCVSSNDVVSKTVTVPRDLGEEELESLVEIEAGRAGPYSTDKVNIDYLRLGGSARSSEEVDVRVVICRKNVIDNCVAALEGADFKAAAVDVDAFALGRVCASIRRHSTGGRRNRTTALVDFGCDASRLAIFANGKLLYTREIPFGGGRLIHGIHEKYGMPRERAIAALRENDLPRGFKTDVLKPFVKTLIQELFRALRFYYSSSTCAGVGEVMISGGCARFVNIEKLIEKRIGIPTVVMNPFSSMHIASRIDKNQFDRDMPALTVASGLALGGLPCRI